MSKNYDLLNPPTKFQEWYWSHEEELKHKGCYTFFPYLVNQTIGQTCIFNPNEDKVRDKIFSILNKFGYGEMVGSTEGYKLKKEMYRYVCEYYRWYKENEK